MTPFAPEFVFASDPAVDRVTYLDADVWFQRSPAPIFAELDASGARALITRHGYAAEYDQSATAGKYCVQFTTFCRSGSETVRQWWQQRCVEWCFAKYEDGKIRRPEVSRRLARAIRRRGGARPATSGVRAGAVERCSRFPYSEGIFFHFHGLRIAPGRRFDLCDMYALPRATVQHVYEPYLADLRTAIARLDAVGFKARTQSRSLGTWRRVRRLLAGVYRARWHVQQLHVRRY